MSVLSQATETFGGADRIRRWVSLGLAVIALVWAVVETVGLVANHTLGAEIYGVLVAVLAVFGGVFTLSVLISTHRRIVASAAVLVLWAIVALGGIAGAYYHAVGVDPKYSPVDPRPRPVTAPLGFTAIALIGAASLVYGQRLVQLRSA
jgi:FtsH-binding integral membrane protein